jgi:hypothetical protein
MLLQDLLQLVKIKYNKAFIRYKSIIIKEIDVDICIENNKIIIFEGNFVKLTLKNIDELKNYLLLDK